jgi:hypothetical protein
LFDSESASASSYSSSETASFQCIGIFTSDLSSNLGDTWDSDDTPVMFLVKCFRDLHRFLIGIVSRSAWTRCWLLQIVVVQVSSIWLMAIPRRR